MINKIVFPDYQALSLATARQIAEFVVSKPDALLCFPAGDTSLGTFSHLISMSKNKEADFSCCHVVGLDEWVHLGEMQTGNCYHFLEKHLLGDLEIKKENICFFDGESENLQLQCELTDQYIHSHGGIDLMLLGVGMNGHVGLNEPGTSFDRYSYVVELDEVTRVVGQKYFSKPVKLTKGITLGMKHIMETKTVILQASGNKKSEIVRRLLQAEITTDFPVSLLMQHPNAFLFIDSDAVQE